LLCAHAQAGEPVGRQHFSVRNVCWGAIGGLDESGPLRRSPTPLRFCPRPALSEDAKAELRGELVTLRPEIQRAIPRAADRETTLHLQGAVHRIGDILEPKK